MKLNNKYNLLWIAAIMLVATSCFQESGLDKLWDAEENWVELEAAGNPLKSQTRTYLRTNTGTTYTDNAAVLLAGRSAGSAVTVNFEIDADNTTAIPGVHYNLISSGSVTIAANSNIGGIEYEVLADNIEAGEVWTLAFRITGASGISGVQINPELAEASLNIQISCPSDLAGDYAVASVVTAGCCGNPTLNLTFTETWAEEGNSGIAYRVEDITGGLFPQGYGIAGVSGVLEDVCDELSTPGIADQYGDTYDVDGTVSKDGSGAVTGIEIEWVNTFADFGTNNYTPQ